MTQVTEFKNSQTLEWDDNEISYNLRDVYGHFLETSQVKITYTRFKKVLLALGEAIFEYILEGHAFKFPYNLGILRVKKRKLTLNNTRMLRVDFAATKREGKTIYHLNQHSNGFYYKFTWKRGYVKNIMKYSFVPVRKYKRLLAKEIIENQTDYVS